MAVDEALLELVGQGASPPTLRFYAWTEPWVSLGSGQLAGEIDRDRCAQRGWDILRRASGGTAVLHDRQVGYAVVLPANHSLWAGALAASYQRFAAPLRSTFNTLGFETELAPPGANIAFVAGAPSVAGRICFAALGLYEHLAEGKKVVGTSQIRRRLANAQHGVIQLSGSQADLIDVLSGITPGESRELFSFLRSHVGSLTRSPQYFSPSALCEAIAATFGDRLGVKWSVGELTMTEKQLAGQLVANKYGSDLWTYRR